MSTDENFVWTYDVYKTLLLQRITRRIVEIYHEKALQSYLLAVVHQRAQSRQTQGSEINGAVRGKIHEKRKKFLYKQTWKRKVRLKTNFENTLCSTAKQKSNQGILVMEVHWLTNTSTLSRRYKLLYTS